MNIEFVNKIRNKTQESIINLPKINYLGGMESLRQNFISKLFPSYLQLLLFCLEEIIS